MTSQKALEQRRVLRDLQTHTNMTLLHGSELNIQPDGSLDWDDEFLAGFDVLVASIHSHFTMGRDEMTARLVRGRAPGREHHRPPRRGASAIAHLSSSTQSRCSTGRPGGHGARDQLLP